MNKLLMAALSALPMIAISTNAEAGSPLLVNPTVSSNSGAPGGENSNSNKFKLKIVNSCFAQNLRATVKPISPNSLVTGKIRMEIRATPESTPKVVNLWVKYPGAIVTKQRLMVAEPGAVDRKFFGGTYEGGGEITDLSMGMYGNTVQLDLPPESANLSVDKNGDVIPAHVTVNTPHFEQKVLNCGDLTEVYGDIGYSSYKPTVACGDYMGKDGDLSFEMKGISVSSNGTSIELNVSFPGQTGFCGGYWSPLMLFFSDERPHFTGASPFPLSSAGQTYWVEPNAPGYFLAVDLDGNGKIDNKAELFGDQDTEGNGFEALAPFDSNKDGVIDAKDSKFKKLVLWQDKNGDGVTQPGELETLAKKGVTKISLKHKRLQRSYGETAEARQVSDFWFKAKGKTQKGIVEDIWFAAVPGSAK